jgi:hypothetical protein
MALDVVVGGANLDANSNIKTVLPASEAQAGFAALTTMVHDGASGLPTKVMRALEVSINKRLRVGVDSLSFQDRFSYGAQNSAVWANVLTTMTLTYAGGYAVLNGGSSVASAAVARMASYKFFPIYNGAGLSFEFDAVFTVALQTSNVLEMGLFQATGTAAPTDGVLFRFTSGGAFLGVINYNGAETTTDLGTVPTTGADTTYRIRVEQEETTFWVNNVLRGRIVTPQGQNGPCMSYYQPLTFRNYNSAGTSLAQQLKVGEVRLFIRDINVPRPWPTVMAGVGGMGAQGQAGQTMGSTALYSNSLAPGAGAAMTNTTAALGTGLGGQFTALPTLTANTDGILCSYQVPAGTAANPGKTLVITGIKIMSVVSAALTGGPCIYAYSLAFGHTALSMATSEGAATKAPRRVPIGVESGIVAGAAVGVMGSAQGVSMQFASPITVQPGEFVAVCAKNIGTVTSAGTVTFLVTFDAHWE